MRWQISKLSIQRSFPQNNNHETIDVDGFEFKKILPSILSNFKKQIIKLSFIGLLFSTSISGVSQTTYSINYAKLTIVDDSCNIFDQAMTIDKFQHNGLYGGVLYKSPATAIDLQSEYQGESDAPTTDVGTAFYINFQFKAGYSYSITMTASYSVADNDPNMLGVNVGAYIYSKEPEYFYNNTLGFCGPVAGIESLTNPFNTGYIYGNQPPYTITQYQEQSNVYKLWTNYTPPETYNYLTILSYPQPYSTQDPNGGYYLQQYDLKITNITITETPPCATATPTGLSETNNGTLLTWNEPTEASSYKIAVIDTHNGVATTTNLTSTTNSVPFCPQAAGDNISFTVQELCTAGGTPSASSAPYSFTAPVNITVPTGIVYTPGYCSNSNVLTWNAVAGAKSYVVYCTNLKTNFTTYATPTTNSCTAGNAELSNGVPYNVYITAIGSCTTSAPSSTYAFTTSTLSLTAPTGIVYAPAYCNNSTVLTWNAVAGANSYNVFCTNLKTNFTTYATPTTNSCTADDAELSNGVPYNVYITANGSCATSAPSSTYAFTTSTLPLSAPVFSLPFTYAANSSGYNLTWAPVTGATSYNVWVADVTGNLNVSPPGVGNAPYQNSATGIALIGVPTNDVSVTITAGHTYMATVSAFNGCSTGPMATTNFTPNACNLAIPYIVSAEAGSGSIWVVAYATTGATSYNVKFVGPTTVLYTDLPPTPLTGAGRSFAVPAGAAYQVYLQANCSSGTSAWSTSSAARIGILESQTTRTDSANSDTLYSIPISSTSITELKAKEKTYEGNIFTLYPVPSSSQIIALYDAEYSGKADLIILDGLGSTISHTVVSVSPGQNTYHLNVTNLSNGIYFVKLNDGKNVNVRKIVIQR